jgi:hypothetical protein
MEERRAVPWKSGASAPREPPKSVRASAPVVAPCAHSNFFRGVLLTLGRGVIAGFAAEDAQHVHSAHRSPRQRGTTASMMPATATAQDNATGQGAAYAARNTGSRCGCARAYAGDVNAIYSSSKYVATTSPTPIFRTGEKFTTSCQSSCHFSNGLRIADCALHIVRPPINIQALPCLNL